MNEELRSECDVSTAIGPAHQARPWQHQSEGRFVTFSDVANNPICPQNWGFSICGETKCPAMVLLKFQHKEHLWEELSFCCVQFASKLTVLRLSKVFHIFV